MLRVYKSRYGWSSRYFLHDSGAMIVMGERLSREDEIVLRDEDARLSKFADE